jgi:hypothetical protein
VGYYYEKIREKKIKKKKIMEAHLNFDYNIINTIKKKSQQDKFINTKRGHQW